MWYQWDYVLQILNVNIIFIPFVLIAPHFSWLFGFITLWGLFVATLHTLGLATLLCTTYLMHLQYNAITNGQTQYEMKHSILDYNLTFKENFLDVFGTKWYLTLFSPYIKSPLQGDGLKFISAKEYEIPKNI